MALLVNRFTKSVTDDLNLDGILANYSNNVWYVLLPNSLAMKY